MKFLSQINVNSEYTFPIVDGTNGQVFTTDGNGNVYWGSISVGATNLDGLTDVILTSPSSGQLLRYGIPPGSGETQPVWYNFTPNYLTPSSSIDNLGDVTITSVASGQILQYNGTAWVNTTLSTVEYVSKVQHTVKAGVAITKGQAVYVTTSDGTNMIVGLASNTSEATSSKVIGLAASNAAINDQIFVVTEGLIAGLNTSTATAGDPVWLGTNGNLIFGLLNKPASPAHLVYIGVVTRVQQNNGEIFVKVQNGIEIDEIHDVQISSPATGQLLRRDSDGYWKNWTSNFLVPSNVSGTTNYISKFTGANTVGNSQIFDNGTNVGIGTTSPTYKLQVNGDSYVGGNLTSTGYGFFNGEGLGTSIRVGGIYGNLGLYVASTYDMQFDLGWDGVFKFTRGNTERMRITSAGNVGIGTTSPATRLDLGSTQGGGIQFLYDSSQVYRNGIYNYWNSGTDTRMDFNIGRTANVAPVTVMSVGYAGNVGIGTTSPAYKLEVNGSFGTVTSGIYLEYNSGILYHAGGSGNYYQYISGANYLLSNRTATGALVFSTVDTERMRITAAGNVGIGTTGPTSKLHIVDGTSAVAIGEYSSGAIIWMDGSNGDFTGGDYFNIWAPNDSRISIGMAGGETLTVTSAGNVGIGTTSPNAKLDVNGAANATSFSSTALFIANADTSGSLQPDQGSPANKIYSFRWQGGEQGYIDTDAKITFAGFKTPTGTASQFLKANGTVDSNVYITSAALSGYATQAWVNSNFYTQGQIDDFFGGAEPISGYNKSNWDAAYNDKVNSASFNTTNGILTLTQQDGGTVTVDLDGRYLTSDTDAQTLTWDGGSKTLGITNGNDVILSELATEDFVTSQGYVTSAHTHTIANVTGLQTALDGKVSKSGDTMTGSLTFADVADNVRLSKNVNWLNLYDPWGNLHLRNANSGYGNYIDGSVHYWRPHDGSSYWMTLNSTGLGIGTTNPIYKFQVAGSAYVNNGTLFLDSAQYIRWGNSNQGIVGENDSHVSIVSGGSTRQTIYAAGRTYFPGLDLSISNVNSSHGSGTYFRGDGSHFVLGLNNGNTFYLNYGNDGGALRAYGNLHLATNSARMSTARPDGIAVGGLGWYSDTFYVAGHPDFGPAAGNDVRVYGFGANLYFGNAAAGDVARINSSGTFTYGGSEIATRTWVQAQGYLTSETDSQTLAWDAPNKNISISNGNTVTLDGLATEEFVTGQGYLTSLPSHNHDDRYYTESESDSRYFIKSGSWLGDLASYGYTREVGIQMTGGSEFVILSKAGQGYTLVDGSYLAYEGGGFYSSNNSAGNTLLGFYADTTSSVNFNTSSVKANGNTIWHAGNDGSGSGLDADLLDGQHASAFATRQDGARYTTNFNSILSSGFFNAEGQPANAPDDYGQLIVAKGIDTGLQIFGGYDSNNLWFRGWGYGSEADGFHPWRKIWHDGNDGSSSGLDADLLDGQQGSYYQPASTAITTGNIGSQSVLYATNATRLYASDSPYRYGDQYPYYMEMRYDGTYWNLSVTPATPSAVRVAYADSAGTASSASSATSAGSSTNLYGPAGSYIKMSASGTSYQNNYQIRENDGGYGNTSETYAPQLAFHWGNVVASSIMMEASGRIAIRNNPGTGYEAFVAGIIYSSGYGNSTQWNTAYGWGNHADAPYWNVSLTDAVQVEAQEVIFAGNVTIQGTLTESSSIRLKENITPLDQALDKVNQLEAVSYNKIGEDNREIGLIAEDVAELFPEVVTYNEAGQPQGIQYQRLSVILLKAVQELSQEVNELKKKLN